MTLEYLQSVLSRIKYKDVKFVCNDEPSETLWIQCQYPVIDQGKSRTAKGRRWVIESDWSDWQVSGTALKAVLTLEEHEAREQFLYNGVSVFYPHYDIDDIVRFRSEMEGKKDVV